MLAAILCGTAFILFILSAVALSATVAELKQRRTVQTGTGETNIEIRGLAAELKAHSIAMLHHRTKIDTSADSNFKYVHPLSLPLPPKCSSPHLLQDSVVVPVKRYKSALAA